MALKTNRRGRGGFSLLEMTVVIICATILATALVPQLIRQYSINAANKVALDISAIEESSRAYYIANNNWPANIAVLQTGNYLPSSWNAINPFGYSSATPSNYSYNISSTTSLLTVSTFVPIAAQPIIQNLLPVTSVSGNNIYSSVSPPGSTSVMPTGSIMPWPSNNLPAGFLWCNGQIVSIATYHGLYAILGTKYGGDGVNTFGLPPLMGRTIVGVDSMGGASPTNLITQWSSAPATMGGTFGESAHRQSVSEMAPHNHGETGYAAGGGSIHELRYSDSNVYGDSFSGNYTLYAGGNGDGTGLGGPANVVQPSIAMGYIIKY